MIVSTIVRRLLVVPLAPNDHGKSALLRALLSQATQLSQARPHMGVRELRTPWGRRVDALVFIRSFQEKLSKDYKGSVVRALDGEDPDWRERDLIILSSHVVPLDCQQILDAGHQAGFDDILVPVLLAPSELLSYGPCMALPWDERWTLSNPTNSDPDAQLEALGRDLWVRVAAALTGQ